MQIWMNGRFCQLEDASIPVTDRGFLLGDGFFETMRAHKGKVAWISAHMNRLRRHGQTIGFPVDCLPAQKQIEDAISSLCAQFPEPDAVIRLTVSRGGGQRGLLPPEDATSTLVMTASAFTPCDPEDGIHLTTSKKVRRNPWSVGGTIKSVNYLDNIVAKQEAAGNGGDDALILSVDGSVAETSVANLFAICGETLWTPASSTGILCGLARAFVLDWARENNRSVCFDAKTPEEVTRCDAVFICNALQGLRRVRQIDDKTVGTPGDSGNKLFSELVQTVANSICHGIVT